MSLKRFLSLSLSAGLIFGFTTFGGDFPQKPTTIVTNKNTQTVLTLQKALSLAERNNPQIRAQYYQYKADKNAYYAQIAQRFGQVSVFYTYNQYKTPRIVAPISPTDLLTRNLPQDDQVRIYGFKYAVRLFDGCQQFFLIRAKDWEAHLSFVNYGDTVAKTKSEVKSLYYQILALKAQKSALLQRKKAVEELYKIVNTAYKIGKKSILDLLNIKAELKSVEAQISTLNAQIEALKRKLAVLLGLNNSSFEVEKVKVKPVRLNADRLLNRLIEGNYQLKEVSVQKKITDEYKKAALAEFSPKVDFVYINQRYRYDGETRSDWQYTLQVTMPIFDFGLRFFNYRRARDMERKVEQLQRLTERTVVQNFYALVKDLNSQLEVINAYKDRLKFAEKAYKIERKKYLLGKSDVYNLLKAEALYFGALGEYEAGIYLWASKKAQLDYMLGN